MNFEKLDSELRAAGIPIAGCSSDGRIDYLPSATPAQIAQGASIFAAHDPALTQVQKFRAVGLRPLDAALAIKASPTVFATLTPAQQAQVQAIIDAKAALAAANL